jgi:GTP 3',8-cyclase
MREDAGGGVNKAPSTGGETRSLRDGYGRLIDYLRVSVTDRCNSRCLYCMPREGVTFLEPGRILSYEQILLLADIFLGLGIRKIRITGGEPLIRKNILFLIEELGKKEALAELVLTTNGIRLAEHARALKRLGVRRVNVSLDTLERETFIRITGQDALNRVLEGVDAALDAGLQVKLNTVAMRGVNEGELPGFVAFALERGVPVRFIELMPQRYNRSFAGELFLPAREIIGRIGAVFSLGVLETGCGDAESGLYEARGKVDGVGAAGPGRSTTVGMISPMSEPFCRQCNRVRLMADGTLKTCLFGEEGPNLKDLLEGGATDERIEEAVLSAVRAKPRSLRSGAGDTVMHRTGG